MFVSLCVHKKVCMVCVSVSSIFSPIKYTHTTGGKCVSVGQQESTGWMVSVWSCHSYSPKPSFHIMSWPNVAMSPAVCQVMFSHGKLFFTTLLQSFSIHFAQEGSDFTLFFLSHGEDAHLKTIGLPFIQ